MTFEGHEIRHQTRIGIKLVLIGGIFFVASFIAQASQPGLGFGEQSLLSLVIMVSVPIWVIGGVCLGVVADNWLVIRGRRNALNAKCRFSNSRYVNLTMSWQKSLILFVPNILKPQKQTSKTDPLG